MKQTNLYLSRPLGIGRDGPCLWSFAAPWIVYGLGMALLWGLAGTSVLAQGAVWTAALLLGAGLAVERRELWR